MAATLPAKPVALRDAAQQAVYSQAFKDVAAHVEADDAFGKVKGAVESHLGLLQKQAQVRVRNWLKKLSEEVRARWCMCCCRCRRRLPPPAPAAAIAQTALPKLSAPFSNADSKRGVEEEPQRLCPAAA